MSSVSQWQCGLHNSKDRDNALFLNERLSDLTIIFPLQNMSFPAHRLMMAKTSPYFENLFYGPMSIKDHEWKVKDKDVDPEVFKVVLAHCYEVDLLDESLEKTLQVYKLADCYMIDSLKSQCLGYLQKATTLTDFQLQHALELSTNYGFSDIEDKVFEILSSRLNLTEGCLYDINHISIYEKISNLLLNLPLEKHKELLSRCEHLDVLLFEESWHHPKQISDEVLLSIFESSSCKNGCVKNFSLLKGCISPRALTHFITMKRLSYERINFPLRLEAYISLIDASHSQALYECVKSHDVDDNFMLHIHLHIPCYKISPEVLSIWSHKDISLYLSDVDDQSVPWVVDSIVFLNLNVLFLPRCSLSFNGFKTLVISLKSTNENMEIHICSTNMKEEEYEEYEEEDLNTLTKRHIEIYGLDEDMKDW